MVVSQGGGLAQAALLSFRQALGHPLLQPHSQLGLHLDPLALVPGLGGKEEGTDCPLSSP